MHTLTLLELALLSVPGGEAFLEQAGPAFEAYASGDHSGALAMFMAAVSGLEWGACRALLEERVPGAVAQSVEDADTFFGVELPALTEWEFGPEQAAAIERPVLSVLGSETQPLWVEVAEFLRSSIPQVEEFTVDGVGHLLHIQRPEPVARRWRSSWSETHRPTTLGDPTRPGATSLSRRTSLNTQRANPGTRRNNAIHQRQAHRGRLHADQKREIIERLTDTMVSIEGENMRTGDLGRRRGGRKRTKQSA